MLKVTNLSKSFGTQVLFENAGFQMDRGDRLGLIGRNGHGKSTLFRLILGEDLPDGGQITRPNNYRVGHLEQHIRMTEKTVLAEASKGLQPGYENETWKVEKILAGLGFNPGESERDPTTFSGGYQIRINLAKVLVSEPDLLLLDEPTNYLDILSVRWLAGFLRKWPGELMLITHDRHFMDSISTHTLFIHRKQMRKVPGSTGKLLEQIRVEEEVHENARLNDEKKRKQEEKFINTFRSKASKATIVQSRIKMLEKRTRLEKLDNVANLGFSFRGAPFEAKVMLTVENLSFGYEADQPPLLTGVNLEIGKRDRIAIIGPNGRGKSTMMKLLAGELKPRSGQYKSHPQLKLGYYEQTHSHHLNPDRTVAEEIAEADPERDMRRARDIAGSMMFTGDQALKKTSVLSGGEKSRVCLGRLLIGPCHLLLLDEPTNHLDAESCEALMEALEKFEGAVVIITHHEGLLERVPDRLVVFQGGRHSLFEGTYPQFLRDVGWESEKGDSNFDSADNGGGAITKKEMRRLRAERLQSLAPLKAQVKEYEEAIEKAEMETETLKSSLAEACQVGDAPAIKEISVKLARLGETTVNLYQKLETATAEVESRENQG